MKKLIFLALFIVSGCAHPSPSDNAVIEKANTHKGYIGFYKSAWDGSWNVNISYGEKIEIHGEGKTLALAYENALKEKEKLCAN